MIKWILLLVIATIALGLLAPYFSRIGLGRLPGDFRFRKNGREYYLPVTSTVLISLFLSLIARVI